VARENKRVLVVIDQKNSHRLRAVVVGTHVFVSSLLYHKPCRIKSGIP
jgi:hypothetical protein